MLRAAPPSGQPEGPLVSSVAAPIMLRARLTDDEWTKLRQLAIARKISTADLVADALRATYNLKGSE